MSKINKDLEIGCVYHITNNPHRYEGCESGYYYFRSSLLCRKKLSKKEVIKLVKKEYDSKY